MKKTEDQTKVEQFPKVKAHDNNLRAGTIQINDPALKPDFVLQVQDELNLKQNISSAFTQTTADGLYKPIAYEPDLSGLYTKAETDDLLDLKQDVSSAFTQTTADGLYKPIGYTPDLTNQPISNITDLQSSLDSKAPQTTTFTKDEVNNSLGLKADKSTTYTKTEINDSLALKQAKVETGVITDSSLVAIQSTTTSAFLNIGSFTGSFYTIATDTITITKAGFLKVRIQFTIDSTVSTNVFVALTNSAGTHIPSTLRIMEASTNNKEVNIFYEGAVLANDTIKIRHGSGAAAGVTIIGSPSAPATPTGFTGATGFRFRIAAELYQ